MKRNNDKKIEKKEKNNHTVSDINKELREKEMSNMRQFFSKGKLITKKNIFTSIYISLFLIFILFTAFADKIFGATTTMGKLFYVDYKLIFSDVQAASKFSHSIIYNIIYIFIIIIIFKIIKYFLRLFGRNKTLKTRTIIILLDSFLKYVCFIIILLFILKSVGVDTNTLIASAGILTLIIGLGAQPLISDMINGLSIVFENEFSINDVVIIDDFRGSVLEIGLRNTKIIDASGNIKIISNSEIKNLINMSQNNSIAICDMPIEYEANLLDVEKIIEKNLDYIKEQIPLIIKGPEYKGVQKLDSSSVVLRFIAECKEGDKFQVGRDLNRQFKLLFDREGITIPYNKLTIYKAKE